LDFIAVTANKAGNAISYYLMVANGSKTLTTLYDSTGYSGHMLSINTTVNCWSASVQVRSDDSLVGSSCWRPSVRRHSNEFQIQSDMLMSPKYSWTWY